MSYKIERRGLVVSIPWHGKSLRLGIPLKDAQRFLANEPGARSWEINAILKKAGECNAELGTICTTDSKLLIYLYFKDEKDMQKFMYENN